MTTRRRIAVKVCGIRTPEDLTAAEGADLIGVVIEVPGSPRSRSLPQARDLFRRSQGRFRTVAVLVRPTSDRIREVLTQSNPDYVQVHGEIPSDLRRPELARLVPSLAIPPSSASTPHPLPVLPRGEFRWVHLDTAGGPLPGGTGQPLDWSTGAVIVAEHPGWQFMLAGGLTPENVGQALSKVRPHAVDVSSGVESRPGEKSRAKVEAFLLGVRAWEKGTS